MTPTQYIRERVAARLVLGLVLIAALQLVRIAAQGGEPCCMPPSVARWEQRADDAVVGPLSMEEP